MILELKLLAKKPIDSAKAAIEKKIPESFKKITSKKKYYSCLLIEFKFRGIPYRSPQGHYLFGGRAEVSFKAYALNSDELKYLNQEMDKDDLATALNLVQDTTEGSLNQIQEDLEHFIEEKTVEKKEKKEVNKPLELKNLKKDDFKESFFRKFVEQDAASNCFAIYDVFKKSRGMASLDTPEFETEEVKTSFLKKT